MTAPDGILARIVASPGPEAAAMVLDLPRSQVGAALGALGPWEVARLLLGVRADRLAELLDLVPSGMLSSVLARLSVPQIAEMVPLVPVTSAVRLVRHLPAPVAEELLLALPTQHRTVLQELVARPVGPEPSAGYRSQAEQAVRRATGRVSAVDARVGSLLTDVFGRPVQVLVRDRPGGSFGAGDVQAAIGAVDWRHIAALVVLTNATPEPNVAAALREARQRGYVVDVVEWHDERDDGALKRALVRLIS